MMCFVLRYDEKEEKNFYDAYIRFAGLPVIVVSDKPIWEIGFELFDFVEKNHIEWFCKLSEHVQSINCDYLMFIDCKDDFNEIIENAEFFQFCVDDFFESFNVSSLVLGLEGQSELVNFNVDELPYVTSGLVLRKASIISDDVFDSFFRVVTAEGRYGSVNAFYKRKDEIRKLKDCVFEIINAPLYQLNSGVPDWAKDFFQPCITVTAISNALGGNACLRGTLRIGDDFDQNKFAINPEAQLVICRTRCKTYADKFITDFIVTFACDKGAAEFQNVTFHYDGKIVTDIKFADDVTIAANYRVSLSEDRDTLQIERFSYLSSYHISIVVIFGNDNVNFLKYTVESIFKQQYIPHMIQLILVCNGGTAEIKNEARSIFDSHPESTVYVELNEQYEGNKNELYIAAIDRCLGKYVTFVDIGDTIAPNFVHNVVEFFDAGDKKYDIVIVPKSCLGKNNKTVASVVDYVPELSTISDKDELDAILTFHCAVYHRFVLLELDFNLPLFLELGSSALTHRLVTENNARVAVRGNTAYNRFISRRRRISYSYCKLAEKVVTGLRDGYSMRFLALDIARAVFDKTRDLSDDKVEKDINCALSTVDNDIISDLDSLSPSQRRELIRLKAKVYEEGLSNE